MVATTWQTERPAHPASFHQVLSLGLAAIFGAVVAALLITACGLSAPASRVDAQVEDPAVRVYRQALPGVVQVVDYSQLGRSATKGEGGSGSVIDLEGHVLTNHHVVEDLRYPGVVLSDGSAYPADLVGDDPAHDLAVLRADIPDEKLRPLALADSSKLQVGQRVFAIGSPYGYAWSVTAGIVSYVGRRVEIEGKPALEDAIQTDAAINPGSSGGPLLDADGNVVGVSTLTMLNSKGISFAIQSNAARRSLDEMLSGALRTRTWLGVTVESVPSKPGSQEQSVDGVTIGVVLPGSPAAGAQLRGSSYQIGPLGETTLESAGDAVVAIDGQTVRSGEDLAAYLASSAKRAGDAVELTVVRDGKMLEVTVRLGARFDKQADLAGAI